MPRALHLFSTANGPGANGAMRTEAPLQKLGPDLTWAIVEAIPRGARAALAACHRGFRDAARAEWERWYVFDREITIRTAEQCGSLAGALARMSRPLGIKRLELRMVAARYDDRDDAAREAALRKDAALQEAIGALVHQVALRAPHLEVVILNDMHFGRGDRDPVIAPLRLLPRLRHLCLRPETVRWEVTIGSLRRLRQMSEVTIVCDGDPCTVDIHPLPRGVTSFALRHLEIRGGVGFVDRALPRGESARAARARERPAPPPRARRPRPAPSHTGLQKLTFDDVVNGWPALQYGRLRHLSTVHLIDSVTEAAGLPDTLTSLHIAMREGECLYGLQEYRHAHLTRLRDLVIFNVCSDDDEDRTYDGAQLAALTGLTRLALCTIDRFKDPWVLAGAFPRLLDLTLNVGVSTETQPPLPDAPLTSLRFSLHDAAAEECHSGGLKGLLPLRTGGRWGLDPARYPDLRHLMLHCVALDDAAVDRLLAGPQRELRLLACELSDAARARLRAAYGPRVVIDDDPRLRATEVIVKYDPDCPMSPHFEYRPA